MDNDNIVAVFNEIYDKYYKKIFAYFRKDFGWLTKVLESQLGSIS